MQLPAKRRPRPKRRYFDILGKRRKRRSKWGYLDVVKEDMQEVGEREDEVFDRSLCRISCGDP